MTMFKTEYVIKNFRNRTQLQRFIERFITPAYLEYNRPLQQIMTHILRQECKSVIIQPNHIDYDFRNEYEVFYRNTFKNYPRATTKLDFFSTPLNQEEINRVGLNAFQEYYLGYCILRPTPAFNTCETVLHPLSTPQEFILAKTPFISQILDEMINVAGTPFIQQDKIIGVCAQAALWIVSRYMHNKYHGQHSFKRYTLPEITEMATRYHSPSGRPVPSEGLHPYQMVEALRLMNYSPLYYHAPEKERWLPCCDNCPEKVEKEKKERRIGEMERWSQMGIIYRYIESGLPVILCLWLEKLNGNSKDIIGGHAVTVIGHTFNHDSSPSWKISPPGINRGYYESANWVNFFIVHDDAIGPYISLPNPNEGLYPAWGRDVTYQIEAILVPLPPKIHLRAEEAELYAFLSIWDARFQETLGEISNYQRQTQEFLDKMNRDRLVLRTLLLSTGEYRAFLKNQSQLSNSIKNLYLRKEMPEYIWVVEISDEELFPNNLMVGEIILDPTALTYEDPILAVHLPCFVLLKDPNRKTQNLTYIENDTSYQHIIRS